MGNVVLLTKSRLSGRVDTFIAVLDFCHVKTVLPAIVITAVIAIVIALTYKPRQSGARATGTPPAVAEGPSDSAAKPGSGLAAADYQGLEMKPLHLVVPPSGPQDFGISEDAWKAKYTHRITVPGQFFRNLEGLVSNHDAVGAPGKPNVWRTLAKIQEAAGDNFGAILKLFEPRSKAALEEEVGTDPGNHASATAQMRRFQKVEVLLVLDLEGMLVPFARLANKSVEAMPMLAHDGEFLLCEPISVPSKIGSLLTDVVAFLEKASPEALLAK